MTLGQALATAQSALSGLADPRMEARWLVMAVAGVDQVSLMIHPERELSQAAFEAALARRVAGESLAVISGRADFLDATFAVGPGVLVPRPDSETFAQITLGPGPILDLGTGSGALATVLKQQHPDTMVLALERSCQALSYARRNLGGRGVSLVRGSWLDAIAPNCIGTLVANPPYIDAGEPELRGDGVCFEPLEALVAADRGMADLQAIIAAAPARLLSGGWIWLEHGYQQADSVADALSAAGFGRVRHLTDVGGHRRITGGQL
ncbi:HemK family protein methyltransferase [Litorivicinus lipolyticus]|uniref:peptide chain release factor N(5)-glutamine methyltransferase n=1 Tax=Litorivicinus lipolyticus TaxID=418701 RepID=A0A5Q2QF61_9GAMM|nr:HemK/PrmC family methyltransferase [Litorivicinus lipolyticus]QGG81001.1 HemK family protein methyltransferase [Litorivicinus lipolyticus]